MTLCATCSPQASCWVAEDMLLAGPERAFVAAAPSALMTGSWARQPQTTSRSGRPGGAAPPGSSRYGLTWGLTTRMSPREAGQALSLLQTWGLLGLQPGAAFLG